MVVGYSHDHGTGAIFYAFFLATLILSMPEIGIVKDKADDRFREGQVLSNHFMIECGSFHRGFGIPYGI